MRNTKKTTYQKKNYSERNPVNTILSDFLFITGGDPAGIGPEIIRKSLTHLGKTRNQIYKILYFFNGSRNEKEKLMVELSNWEIFFLKDWKELLLFTSISHPDKHLLIIKEVGILKRKLPSIESGKLAIRTLKDAIQIIKKFSCKGLVTAPVSKEWIGKIDPSFRGHTGFLSRSFRKKVIMLMFSKDFSVIPITEHIPIRFVPRNLKKILQAPYFLDLLKELSRKKIFHKKWAFCGLNPHAGDNGVIGTEEKEWIIPFIKKLKNFRIPVEGPLSADSVFISENLSNYDLILTCYHDQGLIPFKSLVGRNGINLTFGLPFLRSSPDHGTAFDIANEEIADPTSMIHAIQIHYDRTWN